MSAGFHELGHAAALHYAGGETRGMGAGVYVVYPAFFTDVSDNYRLPRWSRVRTDLGGFYFNMIFALGIMGLYVLTRHEFLLLMVLMINLEIIHQLLPFLRLDGYWTLADITGVPDFFSQMTAFVRSVLPIKGMRGRKLPELKWWGRVVFALYMLTTVPLLGLLLLLMIKSVPRVLATAWDSFGRQGQGFAAAQTQADILGMGGAAGQALLLAIPVLGLCYTLFSVGRRFIVGIWNWSKPTAARRVLGGLCFISSVALLGFMWVPQLALPTRPSGPLSQVNWEPIAPDERGTLPDAVAGVVATREPDLSTDRATPQSNIVVSATPAGTPTASALTGFTDSQTRGTPEATAGATESPTQAARPISTPAPTRQAAPTLTAAQATSVRATPIAISGTATPPRTPTPPPRP